MYRMRPRLEGAVTQRLVPGLHGGVVHAQSDRRGAETVGIDEREQHLARTVVESRERAHVRL